MTRCSWRSQQSAREGFSYNTSIAPFSTNSYVIIIISVWMILSGVNFGLYYDLWRGRWRRVIQNSELRLYLALVTIGVFAVAWNLCSILAYSWFEGVKHALVQVSSIVTTTGYTSVDYNQWPAFSKLVLFLLMFTGACAGSTTGAIKLIRLIIAGKLVKREVAHLLHSRLWSPSPSMGMWCQRRRSAASAPFCSFILPCSLLEP